MFSLYHILYKVPAIYKDEMEIEYEILANKLLKSGRLRIDTDYECNFTRFSDPRLNINLIVSREELFNEVLLNKTKNKLRIIFNKSVNNAELTDYINKIINDLKKQINKLLSVNPEVMLKLARLFVQSAHPIVINLLLQEDAEVFITYSHNIGDMMDIQMWKEAGSNSGMQSTNGKSAAIFVSCGGNPFGKRDDNKGGFYGDGWPAIARLQIIAAQELGHFADIVRDNQGNQITRHSANFSATKATDNVRKGRSKDLENCDIIFNKLIDGGLDKLIEFETKLKFYNLQKIIGLRVFIVKIKCRYFKFKVFKYARKHRLTFIKTFNNDKYVGLIFQAMIEDMKFNLAPMADVYKRSNPEAEEAIACVEALARVPQQVIKWGHLVTYSTMKDLYKIYYQQVIPSLIENYQFITKEVYKRDTSKRKKTIFEKIKTIFTKKEIKLVPLRDF